MGPPPQPQPQQQLPFIDYEDLLRGATLAAGQGCSFFTANDSYDSIGYTISNLFGTGIKKSDLANLMRDLNNDLTANLFVDQIRGDGSRIDMQNPDGIREEAAVIGIQRVENPDYSYTRSYTKGESSPGGSTVLRIMSGSTISDVIVAAPAAGRSASLRKDMVRAANSQYLQAVPDSSGYKSILLRLADYDDYTGLVGHGKTVTVFTGDEVLQGTVQPDAKAKK